jgi:hypothetical protein
MENLHTNCPVLRRRARKIGVNDFADEWIFQAWGAQCRNAVTVLQNVEQRVEGLPHGTFQRCCLLLVRGNCYSRTKKVGSFNRRAEVGKGRERWRRPVWGRRIVCGRVGPRSLRTQQEDVGFTSWYIGFKLILTKYLHQDLSLKVILRVRTSRLNCKIFPVHSLKAHRGSGGTTLLILLHWFEVSGQLDAHLTGGWMGSRVGLGRFRE